MRELSAGLFYLFCDEKYYEFPSCKRFLTRHIAVPQDGWNSISEGRRDLSEPTNMSRIARVHKLVEDIDGVALITYADLLWKYLPWGERDSIGDITNMARTDHIWSVLMVYGVVQTLRWLELHNLMVKNVDGYYDTRTIKPKHRDAWAQVLTDELRKEIQSYRGRDSRTPNIGRVYGAFVTHPNLPQRASLTNSRPALRLRIACSNSTETSSPREIVVGCIGTITPGILSTT